MNTLNEYIPTTVKNTKQEALPLRWRDRRLIYRPLGQIHSEDIAMEHGEYNIDDIRPSRLNPRKHFNKNKLEELAASISEHGVKESILIRYTSLWAQVCEWVDAC